MKKNKRIINIYIRILCSILLIPMSSCDDKLDIELFNTLDANTVIESADDLELILLSAYGELRGTGLYRNAHVWLPDLMADNIRLGDLSGPSDEQANWMYSADDEIGTWRDAYRVIFHVNILLSNVDRVEDSPAKNRVVGQAYALRALAHFDAHRYYSRSYDRNFNEEQSGIAVVTNFTLEDPIRNTVKEVYDQIFEDLLTARTLLSDVDSDIQANGPYFIDARAVNALLARVSLYAGEWQNAVDYASDVIGESSLATDDDYTAMWTEDMDGEVLFSVWFAEPDEGIIGRQFDTSSINLTFTAAMAELYDADNDIRFNTFVQENTGMFSDDRYLVTKYPGRNGQEFGFNNAKVLRVSEMYLIRAEAYVKLSDDASAMNDLNILRTSRITGYVDEDLSGAALVDAIATERRKELVAEGHRWFDLKRAGQPIIRGADCRGLTLNCTLEANDFRFIYPLPLDEVTANSSIEQNPSY